MKTVTVKRRRIDLRLFVFCILKTTQGYLFVRFLGLLLLLFQPFSHLFIRRRHSAELAANSTVPAKNSFFFIYRLLSMPTVFAV